MPPSTVFSYWRRDHRRSTGPPASLPTPAPASKGSTYSPINSIPQLPELPDTSTFSDAFDDTPSYEALPWSESPLESESGKLNIQSSTAALSSISLGIPSPSIEKDNGPHSSPGEHGPTLASLQNSSQLLITGLRPEQGEAESGSKPTSPFRLSFGKGARNLHSPATENQKRSSTTGTGPGPSQLRMNASPEEPPTIAETMPSKDARIDALAARRTGDRDVSVDQSHHKSGKAMLNLLNPMSLLARRRSSQITPSRTEDSKPGKQNLVPGIPDDYDPRIRGKIIHDFSAPRPRRNVSGSPSSGANGSSQKAQDSPALQSGQSPASRWSDQARRHSDHSPVFKEHFEDDQNVLQVENKGYLQSSLLTNPGQHGYENSIPIFARRLPSTLPEQSHNPVENEAPGPVQSRSPEPVELPADPPRSSLPAAQQQDQDVIPNLSRHPGSLPRHFKSNASRFSFDMGGVESSAQEKLLEEKHKAKEAARRMEDGYFDDFDDEFDNELMDDFDGLEEKIPGVNVDADEDDFEMPPADLKSWAPPALSPVVASPITPAPPRISSDPVRSAPGSKDDRTHTSAGPTDGMLRESNGLHQLPEVQPQPPAAILAPEPPAQHPAKGQPKPTILEEDEDDLYFDDGEFGDLTTDNPDGGFDEAIFDDETSHLYERKRVEEPAVPQPSQTTIPTTDDAFEDDILLQEDASQDLKHMPSVASEYRAHTIKRGPLGDPIPNMGPARTHGGVLTEQNLEVLHNALAFAATESTTQGRFERTFSTSNRSLGQESISQTSHTGDSQPGLVSDDSRLSQGPEIMGLDDTFKGQVYDDDYDDAYFDDAIVAAANAEALENDDEGFYGQEFGFYAQASGNDSSELTNGGYFGPRGIEGITRNHSSRGKFEEPSLTPITERSEWSTRNSVISVKAAHGATSNPGLASPGLAQLVDMGNLDDEMSLSALMKLRRGAWGGSNGSLRSSAGSPPPHTLASSNRGSFTTPSEASPSTAEEGLANMI